MPYDIEVMIAAMGAEIRAEADRSGTSPGARRQEHRDEGIQGNGRLGPAPPPRDAAVAAVTDHARRVRWPRGSGVSGIARRVGRVRNRARQWGGAFARKRLVNVRVAPRSGRPPRFSRQNAIRVRIANILALLALVALYAGCAGPLKGLYPPPEGDPVKWAYVVSHGWHTGIVVRREDIADGIWPEHPDFAPSEYVEVGWGDRAFYQAPEGTVGLALKALFWPTSSVLHIAGFSGPVEDMVSGSDIVAIGLSGRGFEKLILFVQAAYAKDESGRAIPLGPGQYGNSRFYLARGRYHLLNTCNNWTARALRSAGVPITPLYAVTAGNVMYQAGRSGWVIRAKYP